MFRYCVVILMLISLSACGGGSSGSGEDAVSTDQDELILSEVLSIPEEIGNIEQVEYIFHSNLDGELLVEGACETDDQQVVAGNNTIHLKNLATGIYSDCLLNVTANNSLQSFLSIRQFAVDNTPPNINMTSLINRYQPNISPVEIEFESDEAGQVKFTGSCDGSKNIEEGANSLRLENLDVGDYHDCQVIASDAIGNQSSPLDIPPFFVHVTEISYTAFIGEEDSLIQIDHSNAKFNTSTDAECDWGSIETCLSAASIDVSGATVSDINKSLFSDAFYKLQVGNQTSLVADTTETGEYFESLSGHEVVNFQNKLWAIGGSKSGLKNDIWSSADGRHWTKEQTSNIFSPRFNHKVIVFKGKLWVIGGSDYDDLNDIWSSENGIDWVEDSPEQIFTPREGFDVVHYKNKLWLIGGKVGGSEFLNDIWSSSDGVNWSLELENAPFQGRQKHKLTEFNGKIWLVAGQVKYGGSPNVNDVWSSQDGVTWNREIESAPFSVRSGHKLINFGNRMWVIGSGSIHADIWSSLDGIEWVEELENTPFPQYRDHEIAVFLNKIWLIGGNSWSPDESYKNDVWSSANGVIWNRESSEPDLPKVSSHQSTVLNDRIYVTQDERVWSSADGVSWIIETEDSGFGNREKPQMVTFGGKLWLYGGHDNTFTFNSFWSSEDGSTWTKIIDTESLFRRAGHQMLVHDNKLWLFGGGISGGDDVWFSSDGISWEEIAYNTKFTSRSGHQAVFFKDKFWLIGGNSGAEIWSSESGADWTLENGNAAFGQRVDYQVTVFKEKLWLTGGTPNLGPDSVKNDVWSSIDGANWVLESENAAFSPRYAHQVEVFDEQLWLIGGKGSAFGSLNEVWVSGNGVDWRKSARGKFLFP
jgi:hypothetical protein